MRVLLRVAFDNTAELQNALQQATGETSGHATTNASPLNFAAQVPAQSYPPFVPRVPQDPTLRDTNSVERLEPDTGPVNPPFTGVFFPGWSRRLPPPGKHLPTQTVSYFC